MKIAFVHPVIFGRQQVKNGSQEVKYAAKKRSRSAFTARAAPL
jgi:hypothetical protein